MSEGGSPAVYVWSKNAERRQLTTGQRAIAAQALMPFLEAEAKERQREAQARGRDSRWNSPNSEQSTDDLPNPGKHGRAAVHAAHLAGVATSVIYEAKKLVKTAEEDMSRRHLTASQRAMAGAILLPQLQREAKKRQLSHLKHVGDSLVVPNSEQRDDAPQNGRAIVVAGKFAGVGAGYVNAARKILDKAESDPQAAREIQDSDERHYTNARTNAPRYSRVRCET